MQYTNYRLLSILIVAAISGPCLVAKNKHARTDASQSQDRIAIEGHMPAGQGTITRFVATQHYDRWYVYAEHGAGKSITLIDVTQAGHPKVLSELTYPAGADSASLLAVAGTAALSSDTPSAAASPSPTQTIRLMDFSDPASPKVTKTFDGVTAVERIPSRGLILLANAEGIWILSQRLAEDPEVERRYAHQVVYGESMY